MTTITILLPVLNRPEQVARTLTSIANSLAPGEHADPLFLLSPNDTKECEELERQHATYETVTWKPGAGDYARKINHGANITQTPWLFTGADDLHFHPGWLTECLQTARHTGALVIGTNDLGNPTVKRGLYATHLLVHRSYLDRAVMDAPGQLFCQEYRHNCVDTELVETAKFNHVWAFAANAHVEHLHHVWGKSPDDATYRKGRADHPADRRLLGARRHLWSRRVVKAYPTRPSQRQVRRHR